MGETKMTWWSRRTQSSPPPMNTSQIHLHTSTCDAVLTENKLETGRRTDTAKALRKIHMESGRKGREAIRSGPVLLGGDIEKEEIYLGSEILPLE